MAGRAEKHAAFYVVPVELTGGKNSVLHARAEIILVANLPREIPAIVNAPVVPYTPYSGPVYTPERLFHGQLLQGIETVEGCAPEGITALVKAAAKTEDWIKRPLRNGWLANPLAIDCAFQLMILWSFECTGYGSLPTFVGHYRQFQDSFPAEGARVLIRVTSKRSHGACADIEFLDRNTGKLIARLENYECIIDASLQRAFRRNQLARTERVELDVA
jgi:hypothetical protein